MDNEDNNTSGVQIDNMGYAQASALQVRLDTASLLLSIKTFLEGKQQSPIEDKHGNITWTTIDVGAPKANARGIQGIMSCLTSAINTQVVQGNFDMERYEMFLYRFHKNLAKDTMRNLTRWNIDVYEYPNIINHIMNIVELFISRTINDGERRSYTNTIQHKESNTVRSGGSSGGLKAMFGG